MNNLFLRYGQASLINNLFALEPPFAFEVAILRLHEPLMTDNTGNITGQAGNLQQRKTLLGEKYDLGVA